VPEQDPSDSAVGGASELTDEQNDRAADPAAAEGGEDLSAEPTAEQTEGEAEAAAEDAQDDEKPKEWWDDPRMPWKGKPGRADILCWIGISLSGVIGLAMIPLRPILIGTLPLLLVALTGSRSGLVTIGALGDIGQAPWWPIGLILGAISAMKWDPIFWWAGKLWGHGLIAVVSGRSRWASLNAQRAERLARKWGIPAILLTYVLPIPSAIVYATVGMAGMRLRTFIITDLIGSALICSLWVFLGFQLGQSAVNVVDLIAKYSGWISMALVAIIIFNAYWQSRRRSAAARS
jgi:membrane protein DedA with SNARE-associated domain